MNTYHVRDSAQSVAASSEQIAKSNNELTSRTEQSDGVQQVSEAVTQMDQTTQQNASLVADSASAANHLSSRAQQLIQAMAIFKLEESASFTPNPRAFSGTNARPINPKPVAKTTPRTRPVTQEDDWQSF